MQLLGKNMKPVYFMLSIIAAALILICVLLLCEQRDKAKEKEEQRQEQEFERQLQAIRDSHKQTMDEFERKQRQIERESLHDLRHDLERVRRLGK